MSTWQLDEKLIEELHAYDHDRVLEVLDTNVAGLTKAEALKRQLDYGKNLLPKPVARHMWKQLLQQFTHFMALLLWAGGIMAFLAGMPQLGWATWAVIVINAVFSFWQEYRADQAIAKLGEMLPKKVNAYRDGKLETILAEDVVMGDILVLEAGDQIPADARVIETEKLLLDISMLTGESLPVERTALPDKDMERTISQATNLLFAGTTVSEGRATVVVYAIGRQTEIGKITHLTAEVLREKSTLEIQVERIVRLLTIFAVLLGVLACVLAVWLVDLRLQEAFIFGIGIIVALVPEGLLPEISLSLAIGVQRMAKQNALVRRLSAVETLSAVTVICTDKTGTITENELTLRKLWLPGHEIEVSGNGYAKGGEIDVVVSAVAEQVGALLTAAVVCSDAKIETDDLRSDYWQVIGDTTEGALLVGAAKFGIMPDATRVSFKRKHTLDFDSKRKMMSVVLGSADNRYWQLADGLIFTKGAPLEVMNCCSAVKKDGLVFPLTQEFRKQIMQANDDLADRGYRILALAYKQSSAQTEAVEKDLVFIGLVAMYDPPRPEVAEAIRRCKQAGIEVAMITGDYGRTAAAIGRKIGLVGDGVTIVTGDQVTACNEQQLQNLISSNQTMIFARATPENKLKIVNAYKALDYIVAVTGDGVNDAPALRAAHIGISMGRGGTDVAREVSDIILLDDNFATIIKAVEQGRAIYDNIRKFMTYILTSNIPELVPFAAMIFAKIPLPLTVLQVLAVDLGTDMFPALGLGAEKPEQDILKRKPRSKKENLLNAGLFARAYGFIGLLEGLLSMLAFAFVWMRAGYSFSDLQQIAVQLVHHTASQEIIILYQYSTTMTLTAIVACQIGNLFVCRSETRPFWEISLRENMLIWYGICFEIVLILACIYLPIFAGVFQLQPLMIGDILLLLLCPIVLMILEESRKHFSRRRRRVKPIEGG